MKQINPKEIESPEEQEARARQRLRPKPMVISALAVGAIVLIVPAGGPWMSQEAFISAMGRLLSKMIVINLLIHFALALVYGWIIASIIYSRSIGGGILLGTALGAGLYGVNYLIFGALLGYHSNELHVFIAHVIFGLFFSAAYKAASVPRPRWRATGEEVGSKAET